MHTVSIPLRLGLLLALLTPIPGTALPPSPVGVKIDAALAKSGAQMIEWRRHLHQHPELGNHEFETAKFVAERLREMGLEPRTGVARTGVVAVIEGGKPGKVVALRADMDALPVTEEVDLPFASKATSTYEGKPVGVMHACGHDWSATAWAAATSRRCSWASPRSRFAWRSAGRFSPARSWVASMRSSRWRSQLWR